MFTDGTKIFYNIIVKNKKLKIIFTNTTQIQIFDLSPFSNICICDANSRKNNMTPKYVVYECE